MFVATLSFHLLGWGGQGEELVWGWRGSIGAQVGAHKVWAAHEGRGKDVTSCRRNSKATRLVAIAEGGVSQRRM